MPKTKRWGIAIVCVGLVVGGWVISPVHGASVDELKEELDKKKDVLKTAEERIAKFRDDIQLKKKEARSLEEQISIIEDSLTDLTLSIERNTLEIEKTALEIQKTDQEIEQKEIEIEHQKELLADYLRALNKIEQQSFVNIFLRYTSFSEVIQETNTFAELQGRTQEALKTIQQLKDELTAQRSDLEQLKKNLENLKARQQKQQNTLAVQQDSKTEILALTNEQEKKFQQLLGQAQADHQNAEAEIKQLDAAIREELRQQGRGKLPSVGVLSWPVEPIFGVSCPFHCPGYPYAYLIGPHSGIDIPTYVGTPVQAPAEGYVARVHDAGGPGYNYILLLHGDELSTVYGHLSGFAVKEGETITQGTVIGYTGGAPGTRGAGLSSGPHLHFEVRRSNNAIDPMSYL